MQIHDSHCRLLAHSHNGWSDAGSHTDCSWIHCWIHSIHYWIHWIHYWIHWIHYWIHWIRLSRRVVGLVGERLIGRISSFWLHLVATGARCWHLTCLTCCFMLLDMLFDMFVCGFNGLLLFCEPGELLFVEFVGSIRSVSMIAAPKTGIICHPVFTKWTQFKVKMM